MVWVQDWLRKNQSDYMSVKIAMKKLSSQERNFLRNITEWIKKEVLLEDETFLWLIELLRVLLSL